jgi:hypothetical protein
MAMFTCDAIPQRHPYISQLGYSRAWSRTALPQHPPQYAGGCPETRYTLQCRLRPAPPPPPGYFTNIRCVIPRQEGALGCHRYMGAFQTSSTERPHLEDLSHTLLRGIRAVSIAEWNSLRFIWDEHSHPPQKIMLKESSIGGYASILDGGTVLQHRGTW